jgi:hypothetical protein
MLYLDGVSDDVFEAATALANASSRATYNAMIAGHTEHSDIETHIGAHEALIQATASVLAAAVLRDIATAVGVERDRCLHDVAQVVIDARRACARTRPILENAAAALGAAQDVHRAAYGAYSHDYGNLETALQLIGAGPVD